MATVSPRPARPTLRHIGGLFGAAALVILLSGSGATPILLIGALLCVALPLLLWPELATLAVTFLLYTNIPVIAHQSHGVPAFVSGAYVLALGLPLIHLLLVRRERLRVDPPFLLMLLFFAALLASALGAANLDLATDRLYTYVLEGLVLYALIINVVRGLPTLRRVIWTVLAAGALLGALSVYQAATGSNNEFGGLATRNWAMIEKAERTGNVLNRPLSSYRAADRAEGPLSEPNRYAQIMIVLLPLALLQFRSAHSHAARSCAALFGMMILGGTLLSFSRGAFVTLVLLGVVLAFIGWIRPNRLIGGALLLVLVVAAVAPGYYHRVATIGTATDLVSDDPNTEADGAIRGRATEMLAALHAFLDHPVFGVGPGQYAKVYSVVYHQTPGIQFREIRGTRRAHSLYLELAADTGVVGLTIFSSIVFVLMRSLSKVRRFWAQRHPEFAEVATAFWLSILAYLGTGVFLHLAFERFFWFLLALSSAAVHVLRAQTAAPVHVATVAEAGGTHSTLSAPRAAGAALQVSHILPGEME